MKAYTIAAGLILTAATAMSQQLTNERPYLSSTISYSKVQLQKAAKNFLASLNSNNEGVVESVIAQVAHMQSRITQEDLKAFETVVNELATTGRTPTIRYKAYLAGLVFANPRMFSQDTAREYASADEFFAALSLRVQKTLLGYNGN